jgi:hypothetical protein
MYTALRNLLLLALFAAATGCASGTCSDYKDNIFGNPPGCECLDSAFGCGPFDYPTGYGYAESSRESSLASKMSASGSNKFVSVSLTQVSSTCPGLLKKVSTSVTVASAKKAKRIRSAQLGSVLLSSQRGKLRGKIKRAVPLVPQCAITLDLILSGLPTKKSSSSGVINGAVTCQDSSFSCAFVYRADLTVH